MYAQNSIQMALVVLAVIVSDDGLFSQTECSYDLFYMILANIGIQINDGRPVLFILNSSTGIVIKWFLGSGRS